jgi:hypothetical protein
VFSGRSEPDPAQASAELARLLGTPPAAGSRPPGPGAALMIEASLAEGASASAVLRIGGLLDQPVVVSSWDDGRGCG